MVITWCTIDGSGMIIRVATAVAGAVAVVPVNIFVANGAIVAGVTGVIDTGDDGRWEHISISGIIIDGMS